MAAILSIMIYLIHLHTSGPSPPPYIVSDFISRASNTFLIKFYFSFDSFELIRCLPMQTLAIKVVHQISEQSCYDWALEVQVLMTFLCWEASLFTLLSCQLVCLCALCEQCYWYACSHALGTHTYASTGMATCTEPILLCDNLFYSLTAMPCLRTRRKETLYPNIPLVISPVSLPFPIFRAFPLPPHRLQSPQPSAVLLIRCVHAKENKECGAFIFASLFCNFTIQ